MKKFSVTEEKNLVKNDLCLWIFSSRRQPSLLVEKVHNKGWFHDFPRRVWEGTNPRRWSQWHVAQTFKRQRSLLTNKRLQWGSWNNSLNWRKVFKYLNFIWQTWYLKYKLFNWCLCPWVFRLLWKPKLFFQASMTARISKFWQI